MTIVVRKVVISLEEMVIKQTTLVHATILTNYDQYEWSLHLSFNAVVWLGGHLSSLAYVECLVVIFAYMCIFNKNSFTGGTHLTCPKFVSKKDARGGTRTHDLALYNLFATTGLERDCCPYSKWLCILYYSAKSKSLTSGTYSDQVAAGWGKSQHLA